MAASPSPLPVRLLPDLLSLALDEVVCENGVIVMVEQLQGHMPTRWKSPNQIDPTITFIAFLITVAGGRRTLRSAEIATRRLENAGLAPPDVGFDGGFDGMGLAASLLIPIPYSAALANFSDRDFRLVSFHFGDMGGIRQLRRRSRVPATSRKKRCRRRTEMR